MLWHDYCPQPNVMDRCPSTFGVFEGIAQMHDELLKTVDRLFWIEPSWLLLSIR
jgi:hypothetical protein